MTISFPPYVTAMLHRLHEAGHEAYAVGGCIRDSLLSRCPNDWDITTSACPEETEAAFDRPGFRVHIGTGLRHGTVTVSLAEGPACEITTYRTEGTYTDHRRPDSVRFVDSLYEDLARRDFTVNAMAACPRGKDVDFHDPFGGEADLRAGLLRCVGEAERRFTEDALRILRGLRFAAQYGFSIEAATAAAMDVCAPLLAYIAPERIGVELTGLLAGPNAGGVIEQFPALLRRILPPCSPEGVAGLLCLGESLPLHLALLCRQGDPTSVRAALLALALGTDTAERTARLLRYREAELSTHGGRCVLADAFGEEGVEEYLRFRRRLAPEAADWDADSAALRALFAPGICYNTATLAIGGRDLIEWGVSPGPALGQMLHRLTEAVIAGEAENRRDSLRAWVKESLNREIAK